MTVRTVRVDTFLYVDGALSDVTRVPGRAALAAVMDDVIPERKEGQRIVMETMPTVLVRSASRDQIVALVGTILATARDRVGMDAVIEAIELSKKIRSETYRDFTGPG